MNTQLELFGWFPVRGMYWLGATVYSNHHIAWLMAFNLTFCEKNMEQVHMAYLEWPGYNCIQWIFYPRKEVSLSPKKNYTDLSLWCIMPCGHNTPQNITMVWLWFWMRLIVILEVRCWEDISAARFVSPYTTGLGCTPRYASAFLSLSSLTMLLISPRKHVWRDKEWRKPTTSEGI